MTAIQYPTYDQPRSRLKVLVVDDDTVNRELMLFYLRENRFHPVSASGATEALHILKNEHIDLIVSDYIMPDMDGLALLREVQIGYGDIPFIMITAYGDIEGSVAAIKQGANDYLLKPLDEASLIAAIHKSLSYQDLITTSGKLQSQLTQQHSFGNIITKSQVMIEALLLAKKVAANIHTNVALFGESGTGKEVIARAIHYSGKRMANPFVAVNCAGIPSGLLESELFGHVRGAFTGAEHDRPGKFSKAEGGTLLLDEIGDTPLDIQAKLLRVLETKEYTRVGSDKPVWADARIIVATNKDLGKMVEAGTFRHDLYYRINIFPIHLPPLRERKEDISFLAKHFLATFCEQGGKAPLRFSEAAITKMRHYSWPGNIRELRNCIERAVIMTDSGEIHPGHINICTTQTPAFRENKDEASFNISIPHDEISLNRIIDHVLEQVLAHCENNKSRAAAYLHVDRKLFYRRNLS